MGCVGVSLKEGRRDICTCTCTYMWPSTNYILYLKVNLYISVHTHTYVPLYTCGKVLTNSSCIFNIPMYYLCMYIHTHTFTHTFICTSIHIHEYVGMCLLKFSLVFDIQM